MASSTNTGAFGSSPRVRGTRRQLGREEPRDRFIPARAGNAATNPQRFSHLPVHPRACGERRSIQGSASAYFGSSPRVRGTPATLQPLIEADRFIPARAGNAGKPDATGPASTVHPRACGERVGASLQADEEDGSSPRVRGTLDSGDLSRRQYRFIPARAGNAFRDPVRRGVQSVHPRACGERGKPPMTRTTVIGSSPRVRGTRFKNRIHLHCSRFIPARAGNALA